MEHGIRLRTVILLWLLMSIASFLQSQSAGDIDTLSQWRVDIERNLWHGDEYNYLKYYISGKEVYDSLEFYKVYKSGYQDHYEYGLTYYDHIYVAGLREEGDKWYQLAFDNQVVLQLYDFTQSVGDTASYYPYSTPQYAIITEIDTIQIDGEDKKRFHLNCASNGHAKYIIEDVGSTKGLLISEPLLSPGSHQTILHCYAIDDVPQWINPDGNGCELSVKIEEPIINGDFFAYPNPFTASTTIEYELNKAYTVQFKLYNAYGMQVYETAEQNMTQGKHSITLSLHHLPAGLYYAILRSEDGVSVVKLIKQ